MNKTAMYGALLVVLGLAIGISLARRDERDRVEPTRERSAASTSTSGKRAGAGVRPGSSDRHAARLERRIELLASKLATEARARHRVEDRLEQLASQLAALRSGSDEPRTAAHETTPSAASGATVTANGVTGQASAADSITAMERALVAAGIDAPTAAEMKRQQDELELSEIYLRDLATREGWLNTPRFAEERAEIDRQRTSIRAAIGDEAYDRYLAALDHPNRVAVNEVLLDSPAAVAGLLAGDVVLRYGDTRIFAPSELVAATHSGTAGEAVHVEILRAGQRFEIEVPRGPLGVRVAASRGDPAEG